MIQVAIVSNIDMFLKLSVFFCPQLKTRTSTKAISGHGVFARDCFTTERNVAPTFPSSDLRVSILFFYGLQYLLVTLVIKMKYTFSGFSSILRSKYENLYVERYEDSPKKTSLWKFATAFGVEKKNVYFSLLLLVILVLSVDIDCSS